MSGRDPRVTPRVGDDLLRGELLMAVRQRRLLDTHELVVVQMTNGVDAPTAHWMTMDEWRRWAANAEVLRTAEEVQGG